MLRALASGYKDFDILMEGIGLPYHIEDNGDRKITIVFRRGVTQKQAWKAIEKLGASLREFIPAQEYTVAIVSIPKGQEQEFVGRLFEEPAIAYAQWGYLPHPHDA